MLSIKNLSKKGHGASQLGWIIMFFFALSRVVEAAPESDYLAIHAAYMERDGAHYSKQVHDAINYIRGLTPDLCAREQGQLLESTSATKSAFDGLESVWLLLQDCAARSASPAVKSQVLRNAQLLVEQVRFAAAPAPQMRMYVARHNGLIVRTARGDAMRAMIEQAQQLAPSVLANQTLDQMLGRRAMRHALCNLAVRQNEYGQAALPDLIVQAMCAHAGASGGFGTVDEMCRELLQDQSMNQGNVLVLQALDTLGDRLQQQAGIGAADIGRLQDFCTNRLGGSSFGGGMDSLDGHSEDACFGGRAEAIAEVGRLTQLIEECLSASSNDNPLADNGGGKDGGQPADDSSTTVKNDDGTTTTTTKNPDGSTTETTTYSNGHSVSTTTHKDGATTVEVRYPNGDYERVTSDADGKVESAETVRVAEDGSQITSEYDGDGNLVRREEVHRLGDVDDVVVTENGRTYQAIVPAGWLNEAMDRIEKQQSNDQGTGAYIINLWAKPPGNDSSGSNDPGGGFDASNPACFELMTLGFVDGQGGTLSSDALWEYLFGREPGEPHPSTVYPTPDTIDEVNEEHLCSGFGQSWTTGSHCQSLVLCTEGTQLDENCQCQPIGGGATGSLVGTGCFAYNCPEGSTPVPIGLNGCECRTPESEGDVEGAGPRPGPSPDPFADHVVRTDAMLAKPGIAEGSPLVNGDPGNPVIFSDNLPAP